MQDKTGTLFSRVKPGETEFVRGGLRDLFLYRELGIAEATHGKVVAHLVKANLPPVGGTGWHIRVADFQIVIWTNGWAKFMREDQVTLVEAGDVVHLRPDPPLPVRLLARHGIPGNRRSRRVLPGDGGG